MLILGLCITLVGYAQPSTHIDKIEKEIKSATSDTTKVELYNTLYDEVVLTNVLRAKGYAEEGLRLAKQVRYTKGIVESLERIADSYEKQKVYNKAQDFYQQALDLRQKANETTKVAFLYNKVGVVASHKNLVQGLKYFRNALDIFEQNKNLVGIAITLTNMGDAYSQQKDFNKALDKYKDGFALADSLKDHSLLIRNLIGLGEVHYRQKQYKEAELFYKQLLGLSKNNKRIGDMLTAYERLAELAAEQEQFENAYKYHREYVKAKDLYIYKLADIKDDIIIETQKQVTDIEKRERQIEEQNTRIIWLLYAMGLGGVITFVILVFAVRSNLSTRKANTKLAEQKSEMEAQNQILAEQKRQIEHQNEAINRKNDLQEAAFQEIERKNKEITSSINYAKRIQESILPTDAKIMEGLPEHFIFFRPRDIVSGDFYWFTQRNGKIIIAALDCTGHGVPGAIMSMLGDSYLNQIIKLQGLTDPQHILDSLHINIGVALNQEESQNQDGMDIAICVIDKEKKTMEFAGAGRPILLVQDGKMDTIESCKLPVGGFQRDRERIFEKHIFDLTKPTTFYVFSDGFQDQFGGTKGRKFAKSRLEELLFELHPKPMPEQKKLLNKTLVDWMGENRQMDDILIIGVKLHY
jgi:serine phosphatase RsbU (regulator of sigma subunit)